jgi:glycosyltransferase involved in cell wall biosynthesis
MAVGRPVIATAVGGVPDIMGPPQRHAPGITVWAHAVTADSGDVEGYARGLRLLVEDRALAAAMGARGQRFVRDRMSTERLLDDVAELYRSAVEGRAEVRDEADGIGRGTWPRVVPGEALRAHHPGAGESSTLHAS